jgi:gas vesicle protein
MDKREKKGLAIGAAIGAVAGVVAGILFAPKSGKETRADIKNASLAAAHAVQNEAAEILAKAKNLKGKTADKAAGHIEKAKHTAANLKDVVTSFKAGEASDKDLDKAIKNAKLAQESLKTFMKK